MAHAPTTQMPLRLPASLHRTLKAAAAEEGVSLNQYCLYLLSRHVRSPLLHEGQSGEALLQFLEEAHLLQKEMQGSATKIIPPLETQETPLSRWKRLHEKH